MHSHEKHNDTVTSERLDVKKVPRNSVVPLPLIVIVGPTAVGKTETSILLAERLDGEIVSADSRLLYRGMDIGTAKPDAQDRQRIPHHLIDVADPDQVWSLAIYQQEARRVIAEIHNRGRLPFLVGGTGQYVRAVVDSWQIPRVEPDPHLRSTLENWGLEVGKDGLHARLAVIDPEAAANIDPRNVRRTIRALEVILTSGRRFSAQRGRSPSMYGTLTLGLTRPRPELYTRIDQRIESMINAGLVEEVRELLARGYSAHLPNLTAIGYREIIAYLGGKVTLEEATMLIKRSTRMFVRRQANWFKAGDPDIHWFNVSPNTIDEMEIVIRNFLRPAS
jgi:tRNA dimethylallyltransferase